MRLALLSPLAWRTPPRHYGPHERLASLLCEGLVAQGIDVTLFASGDSMTAGGMLPVCPVPYTEVPEDNPRLWEAAHMPYLGTRARDFDLIHNHGAVLPLTCSQLLSTPMVTTLYHPPRSHLVPSPGEHAVGSYYVAPSQSSRSADLDYVATIYPGVDLTTLPFRDTPGTYLAYCGCIQPDEEVTTALDMARRYDMELILAGPVMDRAYFESAIAPAMAQGRVTYAGALEAKACSALLAGAYAFVAPSRKVKPFRLAAVEAMACGTPVIAWNVGALAEIVRDGETGYLVEDVDQAVARLDAVAQLDRQRCRTWVAEHFSVERMVAEYITVFQHILDGEKPRARHATPPWGRWEVLLDEPAYKVKRISVLPEKRLSYQKHSKREEYWTIVQGQALVTLDGRDLPLDVGATIHIPCETAHRIANPGPHELVFIEVQRGTYFGEDDIVRLQDDYGRDQR